MRTLQAVHTKGWLVVDIKPDNIMIGRNAHRDRVFVLDWGIAMRYKDLSGQFVLDSGVNGNDLFRSVHSHDGQGVSLY